MLEEVEEPLQPTQSPLKEPSAGGREEDEEREQQEQRRRPRPPAPPPRPQRQSEREGTTKEDGLEEKLEEVAREELPEVPVIIILSCRSWVQLFVSGAALGSPARPCASSRGRGREGSRTDRAPYCV